MKCSCSLVCSAEQFFLSHRSAYCVTWRYWGGKYLQNRQKQLELCCSSVFSQSIQLEETPQGDATCIHWTVSIATGIIRCLWIQKYVASVLSLLFYICDWNLFKPKTSRSSWFSSCDVNGENESTLVTHPLQICSLYRWRGECRKWM